MLSQLSLALVKIVFHAKPTRTLWFCSLPASLSITHLFSVSAVLHIAQVCLGNKSTVLVTKQNLCFHSDRQFLLSGILLVSILYGAGEKKERQVGEVKGIFWLILSYTEC